jgi:hypothetical protein
MPNDAITPFILAVPQADLALEICGFVRYRYVGQRIPISPPAPHEGTSGSRPM